MAFIPSVVGWAFVKPISDVHRARLFPHAARRDSVLIASSSLNYLVCERGNPRVLISHVFQDGIQFSSTKGKREHPYCQV